MSQYQPVIGLEVHAQLLTATKLFCGCAVAVGAEPNRYVCPVCLGMPGSLPVTNRAAVELGVRAALALDCTVHSTSVFARKHYFYPDLPKGYQISQFEAPFATDGFLDIAPESGAKRARIQRIHFEEDAGKNVHGVGGHSQVDLNRTGTPLVEIVGEPDLHSSAEAAAYLRTLRDVLIFAGVNDGNLEEGSFRCDANVSLRPVGQKRLGTRTELKNINSFRFVQRAIDAEIARQTAVLDAGGEVAQETRSFDPDTGQTRTLRSKADAHDYRYFPEPDLPPLRLSEELIEAQRHAGMGRPEAIRDRWVAQLGLSASAATTLTQHPEYTRFFESVLVHKVNPVRAANWIQTEVLRGVRVNGLQAQFPATPEQVAELLQIVESGELGLTQAKQLYAALCGTQRSARDLMDELGLRLIGGDDQLRPLCEAVLAEHEKNVAAFRAGKVALLGFFVGQVMKRTAGKADPKRVNAILRELLEA